jgi:hypothetical protein
MNGLRKAALYLHGLEEADRCWLLDALSDDEREPLQATLAELDAMGVPGGKVWLPELAEANVMEVHVEQCHSLASETEIIDVADLSRLTGYFENEPLRIVALVLKLRVWSWQQDYIDKQNAHDRKRLLRALQLQASPLKPKVKDAMLSTLAERLDITKPASEGDFDAVLVEAQRNQKITEQDSLWRRLWRR